jgi:hypothetical protein
LLPTFTKYQGSVNGRIVDPISQKRGGVFCLNEVRINKNLQNKELSMAYCTKCGKEIPNSSSFCGFCGESLAGLKDIIETSSNATVLTNDDFGSFVGKNSIKYLAKFLKFNKGGTESFTATWHWPAFFVPFLWFLYRKLYGWAILSFFIGVIPFIGWFSGIVWGITANYIYYKNAKRKILEIKQIYPAPETQKAVIAVKGGVGHAALFIGALIGLILFILILATIAIPQFTSYRVRAINAVANSDIKSAYTAAQAYFADNQNGTVTSSILGDYGYKATPDVKLIIDNGLQNGLLMTARHIDGNITYSINKDGLITESRSP